MSAFRLPRLSDNVVLTDKLFRPTATFIRWWQSVVERIERAVSDLTLEIARITVSYSITATSGDHLVLIDASGQTVTLPTAVGNGSRIQFKLMVVGTATIACTGGQTIDGAATAILSTRYESITLLSDDANWMIV